jgi:hypothetical protein
MLTGRSDSLSKQKRPYNSTPGNAIAALMMEQHKKSQRTLVVDPYSEDCIVGE